MGCQTFHTPTAAPVRSRLRDLVARGDLTRTEIIAAIRRELGVTVSGSAVQKMRRELDPAGYDDDPAWAVGSFEELPTYPDPAEAADVAARVAEIRAAKLARGVGCLNSGTALDRRLARRDAARARGVPARSGGKPMFRESWPATLRNFITDDN